jgi:hypothetical protein
MAATDKLIMHMRGCHERKYGARHAFPVHVILWTTPAFQTPTRARCAAPQTRRSNQWCGSVYCRLFPYTRCFSMALVPRHLQCKRVEVRNPIFIICVYAVVYLLYIRSILSSSDFKQRSPWQTSSCLAGSSGGFIIMFAGALQWPPSWSRWSHSISSWSV